jgi:thiamine biosynthesis lipoprotein
MRLTGTIECSSWVEKRVLAMGSPAVIIAGDVEGWAVEWALDELVRLEQCWSRFRDDSQLSRLNRSAGTWFQLSGTLAAAVDRAIQLHASTGGVFDPTIHRQLVAAGYDRPFRQLLHDQPGPAPIAAPSPGVADIERVDDMIRLPVGVSIDLGGVGKGLAADMLAVGLIARGAKSVCISLGGDIRVAGGVPTEGGWNIPVADPGQADRVLGHVQLSNAAIVTSTTVFRRWTKGGQPMHHLIDPRTGLSANRKVQAVVAVAPEAWFAEGHAKAALIEGPVAGRRLLDAAGIGGWVITDDGAVHASEWAPPMAVPAVLARADLWRS